MPTKKGPDFRMNSFGVHHTQIRVGKVIEIQWEDKKPDSEENVVTKGLVVRIEDKGPLYRGERRITFLESRDGRYREATCQNTQVSRVFIGLELIDSLHN
jgi:hypothetical protein